MLANSRQMSLNCVFFSAPFKANRVFLILGSYHTDSHESRWQRLSPMEDRPFEVDGCAQPSLYNIWSVRATHAHFWPRSMSEVLGNDLLYIRLLSGSFSSHTELKIEPNPLENDFVAPGILALEPQLFTFSCCKEPFLVYSSWTLNETQLVSTGRCSKSSSITVCVFTHCTIKVRTPFGNEDILAGCHHFRGLFGG